MNDDTSDKKPDIEIPITDAVDSDFDDEGSVEQCPKCGGEMDEFGCLYPERHPATIDDLIGAMFK